MIDARSDGTTPGATPFGPFTMRWTETGPAGSPRYLLLHGIYAGAHGYEWRRLAPVLATSAVVRVPDLLGAGLSDRPDLEYTVDIVQAAVDALIADAGPAVHVVASSLTGTYALRSAARGAEMGSLTLVTPPGLGTRRQAARAGRSHVLFDLLRHGPVGGALVRALTSERSVSWFQRNRTYADPSTLTAEEVDETRRAGRRPGARHLQIAFVLGRLAVDVDPRDVTRVRPLVVWADAQRFTAAVEADRWREAGAEVQHLPSGLPQVEQPEQLAALVRSRAEHGVRT